MTLVSVRNLVPHGGEVLPTRQERMPVGPMVERAAYLPVGKACLAHGFDGGAPAMGKGPSQSVKRSSSPEQSTSGPDWTRTMMGGGVISTRLRRLR